jgi:hypothetical protein
MRCTAVIRRLEDRIRALCLLAVKSKNEREQIQLLEHLRTALREHNRRLKRVAALKLVHKEAGFQERRAA